MAPNKILYSQPKKGAGPPFKFPVPQLLLLALILLFTPFTPSLLPAQPLPNDTERQIFEEGRQFMEAGDLDGAIASFQDVLLVNPQHTPSHLSLGLIYARKKELNTAIESLTQAVEIDPGLIPGHLLLGQVYTEKKQYDKAKLSYERVITLQPGYPGGYYLLGQLYQNEGDVIKAVELHRIAVSLPGDLPEKKQAHAALDLMKKNAGVFFETGKQRLREGALDQAADLFNKIRVMDPENAQALFNLGMIAFQQGRLDEGISFFEQALEKNKNLFFARLFLGETYERKGRMEDAIRQYLSILASVPDPKQEEAVLARKKLTQTGKTPKMGTMVQSLLRIGAEFLEAGDLDGANGVFSVILAFLPDQVLVHYHLGQIALKKDDLAKAEKRFKRAIEIYADHFPSYFALAELYEQRGDMALAMQMYESLLQVRPSDERARIQMGILLEKEGEIKRALKLYHEVIALPVGDYPAGKELAQKRIDLYEKKFHASFTDMGIMYDSNSTQSTQPQSELSSSTAFTLTYFLKKLERYRIPLKLNLNTRFLHRTQLYFLNSGTSLSYARSFSDYAVLGDYNFGYGTIFGDNVDNGKSFLSHTYTGEISRQQSIPSSVTLRGIFQDIDVFTNPIFSSRQLTGTGILSQNLSFAGSDLGRIYLTYSFTNNDMQANDQARTSQSLSLNYTRKISQNLSGTLGFTRTEHQFLNEDTLALSKGQSKKRQNTSSSATLGLSYMLQSDLTFFINFTRNQNRSNLPVPSDLDIVDINSGQVASLGDYDQNLISLGLTGTADLEVPYPRWGRLGKQFTVGLTTGYYRPSLKELNQILSDPKTVIAQDPNHLLPTNPQFLSETRNLQMAEIKGSTTMSIETEWAISPKNSLVFSVSEWKNSTVRTDIVPLLLSPNAPALMVPRSARYNLTINQIFLSWRYSMINKPTQGRLFFDLGLFGGSFTNLTADALVKVEDNPIGDPFASLGSFEARGRSFTTRAGIGGEIFIRSWLSFGLSANYVWGAVTELTVEREFPSSFAFIQQGLPGVPASACAPLPGASTEGQTLVTVTCDANQLRPDTRARVVRLDLNGIEAQAALRFHFGKGKPGRTAFEKLMDWEDQDEDTGKTSALSWKTAQSGSTEAKRYGANLNVDGTLKNETAYRINEPITFTKTLTLLRLNTEYTPSSQFAVTARGRAFYDAITDFVDPDTISPRRFENTILTQLPRTPTPEQVAGVDVENSRGVKINKDGLDLREFYLDAQFEKVDLRIGKQIVRWGVVPGSRVTDEINPFDFGEFILREEEDRFIPLMMVKADFFPGDARFELVWVTEAVPHKPAPAGSEFEQFQILEGFIAPESFLDSSLNFNLGAFENTEIGGRFVQNIKGWELGFTAFYHWDDFPASFRRIEGADAGGFSNPPEVLFTPRMSRITTVGSTVSTSFGRIVLNAEFAYTFGKLFGTLLDIDVAAANIGATAGTEEALLLGELRRDFIKYAVGLDFLFMGADMSMQFLQQYIPGWTPEILQDRIDTVVAHFMRKTFMNESLVIKMLTLYFLNEEDILFRPALEARLTDNVKTIIGSDIFIGDRGEEVGQFDFIGFFKDSSRIYIEVVYSF